MSTGNHTHRHPILALCAALILLHGCATYTHISDSDRAALRKVSILPAEHLPVVDIEGIPADKLSTTTDGAVSGALIGGLWTWGMAMAVCAGSMGTACVPAVGVAAGGTVAGGVIGGASAAGSATDTEGYQLQAEAAEGHAKRLNIQSALANALDRAAGQAGRVDLAPASQSEIQVVAGIDQLIIDELGNLRIIGALELHGLNDTPQTHDFEFLYLDAQKPADWVTLEGVAIDRALQRALPPIASRLVDEVAALDTKTEALMLATHRESAADSTDRWRISWQTADPVPDGTKIQLRLYTANAGPPCIDWLRREHYRDASVCLPPQAADPDMRELSQDLAVGFVDVDPKETGARTWLARKVWQTDEGERLSEWVQGPSFYSKGRAMDAKESTLATIKVKPKRQYRILWANRVDCWLYEPELKSAHTTMRKTIEREVQPGNQVIGGICSRDHADPITAVMMFGSTPWTENEVTFWLEGDIQAGHRYRIEVAELKSNLNFRCVVLVDRESDEELDRFCIPAPEDEQAGLEGG